MKNSVFNTFVEKMAREYTNQKEKALYLQSQKANYNG